MLPVGTTIPHSTLFGRVVFSGLPCHCEPAATQLPLVKQSRRDGLSTGLLRSAMCRSLAMTDGGGDCLASGNQRG
ncbi:MAG: hypothetical protein LBT00_11360 [Spirochaetaceae bacterium]|nr:hypothetical protein [Spirochaetaceae bacterium]